MSRLVCSVLACFCLLSLPVLAEPRPISDAEVAAVELVLDYMERGPDAFLDAMAESSGYGKLGRDEARAEIVARVGRPEGTHWSLQAPSTIDEDADDYAVFLIEYQTGIQEILRIDLEKSSSSWRITNFRVMSEPGWTSVTVPAPRGIDATEADPDLHRQAVAFRYVLGFLAAFIVMGGAILRQRAPLLSSGLLGIGLLLFAAEVATHVRPDLLRNPKAIASVIRVFGVEEEADPAINRLGHLSELRLHMQGAEGAGDIPADSDDTAGETEHLWMAEMAISEGRLEDADKRLELLTTMQESPAAELLRARIAIGRDDVEQAAVHYRNRFRHAPSSEDQMFEALLLTSSSDAADEYVEIHEVRGGRNAAMYYTGAIVASLDGELDEARHQFRYAWQLFPMERSELVRQRGYVLLRADPTIRSVTGLDRANAQEISPTVARAEAISIPGDAEAYSVGQHLRILTNDSILELSGGADRAPETVQRLSPSEWVHRETDLNARNAARLLEYESDRYPAYLQWKFLDAVSHLESEGRWEDIVNLTGRVFRNEETPLVALFEPRARALARVGREDEARALAKHPSVSSTHIRTSSDALELLDLAAAYEEFGDFETAEQLCHVASTFPGVPDMSWKVEQLQLRSRLARSTRGFTTDHFRVRITDDVATPNAIAVGNLLEAEYERLSGRLGPIPIHGVVTNVVRWYDFAGVLTGSEHILGYYDGEIVVPLGEVQRFGREIVSILTHELAHALIAEKTGDRAPRWFHEGAAQRLEIKDVQENVFAVISPDELPALETLDASFEGAIDPSRMGIAYLTSLTLIHHLEDAYGPDVIERLLPAFGRDDSSWGALEELTGKPVEALDVEFREWGRSHRTNFVTAQPWPYMQFYSPPLDPELRKAIRFSRDRSSE